MLKHLFLLFFLAMGLGPMGLAMGLANRKLLILFTFSFFM